VTMSKPFDVVQQHLKDIENGVGAIGYYQVPPAGPAIFRDCERYVVAHPELFAGLLPQDARNRCLYLHSVGKIDINQA